MRKICKDLNEEGFRVVAICKKIITNNKKDFNSTDENDMTLLGFIGFLDPPKESAKEAIEGFLKIYLDFNNKLRKESFVFCLAEEGNNQAMWETYADDATGFCIEYQIPNDTFLGQRMLMNLLPIYYGEKESINFFDVLVKGLTAEKQVNGISYEDYEKWFLSSYTKDPSYAFQKEGRIVFAQDMGGNKQFFPFVKSIILGEKISEKNKKILVDLANKKGFEIYQRKLNLSGSKIMIVKL